MKKNRVETHGNTLQILGVGVSSASEEQVLSFVRNSLKKKHKFFIATPNPEMVVKAYKEAWFRDLLNQASIAIPDGLGLVLASKLFQKGSLSKRITGVDLMQTLCCQAAKRRWKVFFLGGKPGIAKKALANLKKRFPGLLGKASSGPVFEVKNGNFQFENKKTNKRLIKKINKEKPHLLFVGFGMGKQEAWVVRFLPELKIGGAMVVGGSFDFISGRVKRAPQILQKMGLEWFWRLAKEPWRIKRQLSLLEFVFLIFKERFLRRTFFL